MAITIQSTMVTLVIFFDICSSTIILERMRALGEEERWCTILMGLQDYIQQYQTELEFRIYKFIGDGWVLLSNPKCNKKNLFSFFKGLSEKYIELYNKYILPRMNININNVGLTFGIDTGTLFEMDMDDNNEYAGGPLNIASRLQGSIGQGDLNPENKVMMLKELYDSMSEVIRYDYVVDNAKRTLKHLNDGRPLKCKKISLLEKPKNI